MTTAATSDPIHVCCVAGARPNFIKVAPLVPAFERAGCRVSLVHTGQHYDHQMSDVFFDELGIRQPDHHLGAGGGSHAEQTARIMVAFEQLVAEIQPDVVVVVGDVNSTVACGLVAAKAGCLVAHVEAGLRSRDWAMPEEVNRVVTDRLSDLLFAPSEDAAVNLRGEGYRDDQIYVVGNVMVDTLLMNRERAAARSIEPFVGVSDAPFGLVTLHRPSNVDDEVVLGGLLDALIDISGELPLVFPVHPRTRGRIGARLDGSQVRLIEPLGYLDFVALQDAATIVLTDSGGVQEETTVLGTPCITLRESTERPITIDEGTNRLAGTSAAAIRTAALQTLEHPPPPRRPTLWDGQAADRIAAIVVGTVRAGRHPRPTEVR